ncbi:MAG: methylenetetrahydrofolate reductase [Nitrospinae bacterium]|nr:methylenetetrahydrofolate reductase [Nitrospinota bacterium]
MVNGSSAIIDSIVSDGVSVSIELYPPKGRKAVERALREVAAIQDAMDVAFTSVTYGAGGSTQEGTLELVLELARRYPDRVVAHLTCVGANEAEISRLMTIYQDNGVRDILALRGDIPEGMTREEAVSGGFRYAADLVRWLCNLGGFHSIGVACYPEGHPETPDKNADMDHFVRKAEEGADYAASQFFFEAHVWERFMEQMASRGVAIPLAPGILPVRDLSQVQRFAKKCGASVPKSVVDALAPYENDPEAFQESAADLAAAQIEELMTMGVSHFHVYALNRSDIILRIADRLGWRR